jgi:hypothetical protein
MSDLPSREVCEPLFESFVLGVHPIVPICHIPTLREEYNELWQKVSPNYSVESLSLILAALYTGAVNSKVVDHNTSTILRLYEDIFRLVDFSVEPQNVASSIQFLQATIIMKTYNWSYLAPFSGFGFLPQVIRFAQSMRLHSDKKSSNPVEQEICRRIWWHLLFLDIESTIATGLPPIIHHSRYTTPLPSLLQDQSIPKTDSAIDLSPMMIAIHGHYQWAHRMQMWFEKLPSHEEVWQFKIQITNLLQLIPEVEVAENQWARIYLNMQIDRAYCMLGLRFWNLDQYKGTGCGSEVVEFVFPVPFTPKSQISQYPEPQGLS